MRNILFLLFIPWRNKETALHIFLQDVVRQSSVNTLSRSKKKAMLTSLDELAERMPSLLDIDHPCAQRQIADARLMVEVHRFLFYFQFDV